MPELERELRELGRALDLPAPPGDLAARVREAIAGGPAPRPGRAPGRRALVVALAVLVLAALGALAVPQARTAILEWLGLRGASVERVETHPVAPTVPDDLGLGELVTLAEARELAPFELVEPGAAGLGPPGEVRFEPATAGGQVAFVWLDGTGDPELLLTEFRAPLGFDFVQKLAGPETEVARVDVNGEPGLWLEGAPHAFYYLDSAGEPREETLRLARNTLLWERGTLTFRLEGDLTQAEALRLARSL
jgi:hypothetical protein